MPYIKQKDRDLYFQKIEELACIIPSDPTSRSGHLNYIVSMLLKKTFGDQIRYYEHNEIIGVLECIKMEFYRRQTAPYEDEKIKEEGDL
jgi:hypothetical protein